MTKESTVALTALALLPAHMDAVFTQGEVASQSPFADGHLCLTINTHEYHFDVAIKNIHRKESLTSLLNDSSPNTLLICDRLTPYLAAICTENGLNFIDTAGNIKISSNGLHLWVEPSVERKSDKSKKSLTDQTKVSQLGEGSVKLLFTLLSQPDILNVSYREIANYANISLGMVSKGLALLETESLISLGKTRRVLDAERMLALWVESYRTFIRPKLGGIRLEFTGDWQNLPIEEADYWGGEVAAEALIHYLHPQELQLFTHLPLQKKLAQLKCRSNPDGLLWLVPAFWSTKLEWTQKSQALLAVAELEASKDSRNIEIARMIYEKYL